MKYFIQKLIRFFLIPFLFFAFISILYLKRDVYNDFEKKENYPWKYSFQQLGDLAAKKIIQHPHNYNSYIFGSSRTTGIYACYLQKKIKNSKFFHFGNWNETIGGIEKKLVFLDSIGNKIENVVIYLDNDFTFADSGKVNPGDHYFFTQQSKTTYLINHYKAFFSNPSKDKLKILWGLPVKGEIFPNWKSDLFTNDSHICNDSIINCYGNINTSKAYFHQIDSLKKSGFLYERAKTQVYSIDKISTAENKLLENINSIFKKHNTNFYIIITPLYDQQKFSETDKKILLTNFGDRLFDFSGINNITNNIYNYPDRKHFQKHISKSIIDSVLIN